MIGNPMSTRYALLSRRNFLGATLAAAAARAAPQCPLERFGTPYKYGKLVLSASGEAGTYDSVAVDCPFVFRHGGRFYMTFVAFDGAGYQTGLAMSDDLVHWKKQGAVFRRQPSSPVLKYNAAMNWILRENGLRSPGNLAKVDGHFLGAYHAYPNEGYERGAAVIGLCRSQDLLHWEAGTPILNAEEGAEWERGGLYKPCLLKHHDTYYLFYNAKDHTVGRWHEQTGVAYSRDLKTWTRYPGNPVLRNGPSGSPDEHFASDPCVLRDGDLWAFYYFGLDGKGVARDLLATGPDLFHPEKCDSVTIDVGKPGSIDSRYAHKPSMIAYRGDLYHFYCAVAPGEGHEIRGISVARSRPWG
jgi:beta-xylosidase